MSIQSWLVTPCVLENPGTATTDAEGVATATPVEVETVCHLQPVQPYQSSDEQQNGGQDYADARYIVILGPDEAVTHNTVIRVDAGDGGQRRYPFVRHPSRGRVGSGIDHIEALIGVPLP